MKVRCVKYAIKKVYDRNNIRVYTRVEEYVDTEINKETEEFFELFDELWLDNRFYITCLTVDEYFAELDDNKEYYTEKEIEKIKEDIKRIYKLCDGKSGGYIEFKGV